MRDEDEEAKEQAQSTGIYTHDENTGRFYRPILRLISASRYLFALAVLSTFVASIVLLFAGTRSAIMMLIGALNPLQSTPLLRTQALEIVDYFLVALVLYVLSMGFYQLMLRDNLNMPAWLHVATPGHMERHLLGVIVTVISVDALIQVANWDRSTNLLGYGVGVAAVIAAITFYIWVHDRHAE